jgi:hypothetical protein
VLADTEDVVGVFEGAAEDAAAGATEGAACEVAEGGACVAAVVAATGRLADVATKGVVGLAAVAAGVAATGAGKPTAEATAETAAVFVGETPVALSPGALALTAPAVVRAEVAKFAELCPIVTVSVPAAGALTADEP